MVRGSPPENEAADRKEPAGVRKTVIYSMDKTVHPSGFRVTPNKQDYYPAVLTAGEFLALCNAVSSDCAVNINHDSTQKTAN